MRTIALSMCVVALAIAACSESPKGIVPIEVPLMPAHPIFDSSEDELESAKAKITWNGTQTMRVTTVVFRTDQSDDSLEDFAKVQGKHYANDHQMHSKHRFSVKPSELRRILSALKPIAAVRPPWDRECLSFCVIRHNRTENKNEGCEIFINDPKIEKEFYGIIFDNLDPNNARGRDIMRGRAGRGPFRKWGDGEPES
jgi:hypothetical protein